MSNPPLFSALMLALLLAGHPLQATQVPMLTTPGKPHGQHHPHDKLRPDQRIMVALQHMAEGRQGEAMRTLDIAAAKFPENAEIHAVRGSMLLQQNKVAAALQDLETAINLNPKDIKAYVNRSHAYLKFGRVREALADLNQAIKLNPDFVPARFNRGFLRMNAGNHQGALADFERCIAVNPHAPGPYFNRSAVYDALGNRTEAIADMERFINLAKEEKSKQAARDILKNWRDKATEATPESTS